MGLVTAIAALVALLDLSFRESATALSQAPEEAAGWAPDITGAGWQRVAKRAPGAAMAPGKGRMQMREQHRNRAMSGRNAWQQVPEDSGAAEYHQYLMDEVYNDGNALKLSPGHSGMLPDITGAGWQKGAKGAKGAAMAPGKGRMQMRKQHRNRAMSGRKARHDLETYWKQESVHLHKSAPSARKLGRQKGHAIQAPHAPDHVRTRFTPPTRPAKTRDLPPLPGSWDELVSLNTR